MLTSLVVSMVLTRIWLPGSLFSTISNPLVTESSGIGASRRFPGVLYTHNDSGDSSRFFRFRNDGVVTVITVTGAANVDWEDMKCVHVGSRDLIYLADIGDNNENRTNIKIYKFDEPNLSTQSISSFETYTLTYPDGPRNSETLIVDPNSGDLYVVSKNKTQTDVYRLPAPGGSGTFVLSKIATIHPDTGGGVDGKKVTGGDALQDGGFVMLRTLTGALEYRVQGSFQNWWSSVPTSVPVPTVAQGEAIAYSPNGRYLYSSSEGTPCPVYRQSVISVEAPQG